MPIRHFGYFRLLSHSSRRRLAIRAAAEAPDFVIGEPGYLKLPRGKPYAGYDAAKDGPLFSYKELPRRAGAVGALLFHLIYDRTWSAAGRPEWAGITLHEFSQYLGNKTDRTIRNVLTFLIEIRLIERDSRDPWRFKTRPENLATAPLLMPVRHPNASAKKRQKRAAKLSAPLSFDRRSSLSVSAYRVGA